MYIAYGREDMRVCTSFPIAIITLPTIKLVHNSTKPAHIQQCMIASSKI